MSETNPSYQRPDPELQAARLSRVVELCLPLGLALIVFSWFASASFEDGRVRWWHAYLASFTFLLTISLGGLFFVLIHHVAQATWSVVVRRIAEVLAWTMPLMFLLSLPIVVSVWKYDGMLYPWAQPIAGQHDVGHDAVHHDAGHGADANLHAGHADGDELPAHGDAAHGDAAHGDGAHGDETHGATFTHHQIELLEIKRPDPGPFQPTLGWLVVWAASMVFGLTPAAFSVRWLIIFAVWIGLSRWYYEASVDQDEIADPGLTLSMQERSGVSLVLYALTFTYAFFDLLMSLDPFWFSTIFGVYVFAGSAVSIFASLIIICYLLRRAGLMGDEVSAEHYHDLGKYLFGFVVFWAYIAFSQYMLIWYGNIPEETGWLVHHGMSTAEPNAWSAVVLLLLFGHFVIPFFMLVSRRFKRQSAWLVIWAVWLLVMHWVDHLWLVMPEFTKAAGRADEITMSLLLEVPLGVGMLGLFVARAAWLARSQCLVPVNDPRLKDSLAFENF